MTYLELASQCIAGYQLLSLTERQVFESSEAGQVFFSTVMTTVNAFQLLDRQPSLEDIANTFISFEEQQQTLSIALSTSPEYQLILEKIVERYLVTQEMIDEVWINEIGLVAYYHALAKLEYQYWKAVNTCKYINIDLTPIETYTQEFNSNVNKIKELYEPLLLPISYQLPLLDVRIKSLENYTGFEQFEQYYLGRSQELSSEQSVNNMVGVLQKSLFELLDTHAPLKGLIGLQRFNQQQAQRFNEQVIINCLNDKKNLENFIDKYLEALEKFMRQELLLLNGKPWQQYSPSVLEHLENSLAYLFEQDALKKTKEHLDRITEAYTFMLATGLSGQSDSYLATPFELYNNIRFANQIVDHKTMLLSLLNPFIPLYQEYQNIAKFEKNPQWKIVRTVMPLIIIAAFVGVVFFALSPLALPEIALIIILIPSLFLAIALAAQYVLIKDKIYQSLRQWAYGGLYQVPEFQVNDQMIEIFGDVTAKKLQVFYINLIKTSDNQEGVYQLKPILKEDEQKLRIYNNQLRDSLRLEFYDICNNKTISVEQARLLVKQRLQKYLDEQVKILKDDADKIVKQKITIVSANLKQKLLAAPLATVSHNLDAFSIFSQRKQKLEPIAELFDTVDALIQQNITN